MDFERRFLQPIHDGFMARRATYLGVAAFILIAGVAVGIHRAEDLATFVTVAGGTMFFIAKVMFRRGIVNAIFHKAGDEPGHGKKPPASPQRDQVHYDDPQGRGGAALLDAFARKMEAQGYQRVAGPPLRIDAKAIQSIIRAGQATFHLETRGVDAIQAALMKQSLVDFLRAQGVVTGDGSGRVHIAPVPDESGTGAGTGAQPVAGRPIFSRKAG